MKKSKVKFKQYEIVIFSPGWNLTDYNFTHPLVPGEKVLFLGLIPNAPGHCAVAKRDGAVVFMVHPDEFRKATDEEL